MKREIILKGFSLALEFSIVVLFFLSLGYYLGRELNKNFSILGMLLGSLLGLGLGLYHLMRKV